MNWNSSWVRSGVSLTTLLLTNGVKTWSMRSCESCPFQAHHVNSLIATVLLFCVTDCSNILYFIVKICKKCTCFFVRSAEMQLRWVRWTILFHIYAGYALIISGYIFIFIYQQMVERMQYNLQSRIYQIPCVLRTEFLQNTNKKPQPICRMVLLSMTLSDLWPGFQGHDIFEVEYRKNGASERQSYYCTIGNYT